MSYKTKRKTINVSASRSSIWSSWAIECGIAHWQEAAELLGVHPSTLTRWRRENAPDRMQRLLMQAVYQRCKPW